MFFFFFFSKVIVLCVCVCVCDKNIHFLLCSFGTVYQEVAKDQKLFSEETLFSFAFCQRKVLILSLSYVTLKTEMNHLSTAKQQGWVFPTQRPARMNMNFLGQLGVLFKYLWLKEDSKFLSENFIGLMILPEWGPAFL